MWYKVTLHKRGKPVMQTHYEHGLVLRDGDINYGTDAVVDANWIIKEWHGRLGFGVEIETKEHLTNLR